MWSDTRCSNACPWRIDRLVVATMKALLTPPPAPPACAGKAGAAAPVPSVIDGVVRIAIVLWKFASGPSQKVTTVLPERLSMCAIILERLGIIIIIWVWHLGSRVVEFVTLPTFWGGSFEAAEWGWARRSSRGTTMSGNLPSPRSSYG